MSNKWYIGAIDDNAQDEDEEVDNLFFDENQQTPITKNEQSEPAWD